MRTRLSFAFIIGTFILLGLVGCRTAQTDTITQLSTIDAILAGAYDGQMTCRELAAQGDLGIGTFDRLDGEMVLLDGTVYQVKADGRVYRPSPEQTTPFACAVRFQANARCDVGNGTDLPGLEKLLNAAAPDPNGFCAVKIHGRFAAVKTRSVPPQRKPYPPLVQVTKNQPVFNLRNVAGTIVGFRAPVFAKGITVPGWHLHFLSDDRQAGGHLLGFQAEAAVAEIDVCRRFLLILPEADGSFQHLDLGRDRSRELEKAEKLR